MFTFSFQIESFQFMKKYHKISFGRFRRYFPIWHIWKNRYVNFPRTLVPQMPFPRTPFPEFHFPEYPVSPNTPFHRIAHFPEKFWPSYFKPFRVVVWYALSFIWWIILTIFARPLHFWQCVVCRKRPNISFPRLLIVPSSLPPCRRRLVQ